MISKNRISKICHALLREEETLCACTAIILYFHSNSFQILNLGKPVKVPELNETQAIELGANLLGETIIYSIGAALLIFEYKRYVRPLFIQMMNTFS